MFSNKASATIGSPTIRNRFFMLYRVVESHGIKKTLSRFLNKVARFRRRMSDNAENAGGSETAGRFGQDAGVTMSDLRIHSRNVRWGLPYQPTPEHISRKALQHVADRIKDHVDDFVFVDIGSGKGLVLLLAAEYPFKRIIGIEFSEALTSVAIENVRANPHNECPNVQCVCADATDFNLPAEPTVLYLFNPFQGKLMDRMIANIKASLRQNPRDLWIVYVNPWEDRKFRRSVEFERVELNCEFSMTFSLYRSAGNLRSVSR